MRKDFCIFILTHGRPDRVVTLNTLERAGYTGRIYLVIDDEDKTADEYRRKYGDKVLQFSKAEVEQRIDTGDNFQDRRTILHARNACFELAKQVGVKYFMELDDDYTNFSLRFLSSGRGVYQAIKTSMNEVIDALVSFFEKTSALSVAMCQGGDLIGGTIEKAPALKRKAMNSFICSTDRPFQWRSTFNEDVATYTTLSRQGHLFFTVIHAQLVQKNTQTNAGGITELYQKFGTYVKAFTTVMHCPSSVQVSTFGDSGRWNNPRHRIHHKINWNRTAPKILREEHKKAQ